MQTVVDIFPLGLEALLWGGFRGELWLLPGAEPTQVRVAEGVQWGPNIPSLWDLAGVLLYPRSRCMVKGVQCVLLDLHSRSMAVLPWRQHGEHCDVGPRHPPRPMAVVPWRQRT